MSVSGRPGGRSLLPLIGGLLIVAGLTAYDLAAGAHSIVIGTVVLGAFFTGVLGTSRQTLPVAGAATLAAVLSGSWNHNYGDVPYLIRVVVVIAGGAIAFLAARTHDGNRRDARRFELLGAIADVADGTLSLSDTAQCIGAVVVPAIADQCVIDTTIGSSELRRLSVNIAGPRAAEEREFLLARAPTLPAAGVGSMATLTSGKVQLIQADETIARRVASSDEDLSALLALGVRSMSVVPLTARGETLGTLTLVTTEASGRRFGADDVQFHEIVAGRTALALDNAGLDRDLRDAERQLGVALAALDEAVTVMDADGHTRYANAAALSLLGFDTAEDLYGAPPGALMNLFDVYGEDGEQLSLADVPSSRLLAGVEDPPPMIVRSVWRATGAERWLVHRVSAIRDERGTLTRVINVIEDVTEMKRAELRSRILAEASDALASSLDYERTLQRVADLAVPALADWCGVAMPDERGFTQTVAVAHTDPAKVALARDLAERYPERSDAPGGASAVIREGVTQRVDEVSDELLVAAAQDDEHLRLLRGLGIRSGMTVPLRVGGRTLGALSLVSAESDRQFDDDDQALAEELGRRAGMAVENARLFTELSQINAELQQGLLPSALPSIPGWATAAHYQPAGELNDVGGDFYDAFETPRGWLIFVGDVTGHGADAARLTAVARFALRAVAQLTGDPSAAIAQLNRMLLDEPELSPVTLACALIPPAGHAQAQVEITCCGHPPPLLAGPAGVREVGEPNPIIGAFEQSSWQPTPVTVAAGETLVFYTDGVTDARGERDELFGLERLRAALERASGSLPGLIEHVADAVDAHRRGVQRDDEALLALRLDPALTGRTPPAA